MTARRGIPPARWLSVAALRTEALWAPRPRAVVGVGSSSRERLARLVDASRPAGVVVLGFAGGLRASLSRGVLVVAERVWDAAGEVPCPRGPLEEAARCLPQANVGRIATVESLASPEDKARLGVDALVVDMESSLLARELEGRGIPFVVIRVVLDALWEDVPPGLRAARWAPRAVRGARRLGEAAGRVVRSLEITSGESPA